MGNSGPEAGKGHTSFSKTLTSALAVSHSFFSIQSGGRDLEKKPLQSDFSAVLVLTAGLVQAAKGTGRV